MIRKEKNLKEAERIIFHNNGNKSFGSSSYLDPAFNYIILNMGVHLNYFVHGTTTDNERNKASGWNDVKLSELGIKQSKELRDVLLIQNYDVVFCSDLQRSVHSAKLMFQSDVQIIQDKRLREINYGDYNSKSRQIVDPMKKMHIAKKFPGGESYLDVNHRVESFVEELKKFYDEKQVGIVSHQAPQLALDVIIKKRSWEQAFAEDWRKTGKWQPGWKYLVEV